MFHYSGGRCKVIVIMESAVFQDIREIYCLHNPDLNRFTYDFKCHSSDLLLSPWAY